MNGLSTPSQNLSPRSGRDISCLFGVIVNGGDIALRVFEYLEKYIGAGY